MSLSVSAGRAGTYSVSLDGVFTNSRMNSPRNLWSDYSSSSPLPLPPPPPLPPPASPPVVVPWSSSVTVFSSVSSSVAHDSCAPRMAAAARLCRLLPTGRKNVVAILVVHFRLHVLEAQVVCVGVPATIHRRVQLAQHTQVRSALPLAARLCRFHRSTSGRLLLKGRKKA